MIIAINGHPLLWPPVGTRTYLENLLRQFDKYNGNEQFIVIADAGPTQLYRWIRYRIGGRRIQSLKTKFLWEQISSVRMVKECQADVYHVPYTGGSAIAKQQVITILDVIPWQQQDSNSSLSLGQRVYLKSQEYAARHAQVVLTISEFSKAQIMRHLAVPEKRIVVTPLAADPVFRQIIDKKPLINVKGRYAIPDHFVLYVGGTDARKNVRRLVDAFAIARRECISHIGLVLIGNIATKALHHVAIREAIQRSNDNKGIVCIPSVSAEDLAVLFNLSSVFVYPSLTEGFGLPPLEAMACGTAVIASNSSSIPEVVGDAGILVDPTDVDAIANAIICVMDNADLRKDLKARGLRQAARFSWQRAAMDTLNVYRDVCQM